MPQPTNIRDKIDAYPVVVTGERWPARHEGDGTTSDSFFREFPFLMDDPRYRDYGRCVDEPSNPVPGSRGGGLFPVLAKTAGGKLVCVVRTGAEHKNTPGAELSLTVSVDRGRTWSPYRIVTRGRAGQDARNPSLGVLGDDTFVLAYGVHETGARRIEVIRSIDGGATWSAPQEVSVENGLPQLHPFGQMVAAAPETLVMCARGPYARQRREEEPHLPEREAYLYWSRDGGCTFPERTYIGPVSETTFLPLTREDWLCYSRDPERLAKIGRSQDGGKNWGSWSLAYPGWDVRPGGRGPYTAPATILRLPSGRILIVHTYRNCPFGLRAVVSRDGGKTFDWERPYVLTDSYWGNDCGYPSTVCYEDGVVVTVAYALRDMDHPDWGTCAIAYVYHEEVFG